MLSWKSKLLIIATITGLAAWTGYRAERRTADGAGKPKLTVRSVVKRLSTPAKQRAGARQLEDLRQGIGRAYPTARESAELWQQIRAYTVEEVKSALESLPHDGSRPVNELLLGMLYFRWGQLEPEAAAQAVWAAEGDRSYLPLQGVLCAWAERDLDAALRWARAQENPTTRQALARIAAKKWIFEDPRTALARARAEFPEASPAVIRALAQERPKSPESRKELLSLLGKDASAEEWGFYANVLRWSLHPNDSPDEIAAAMTEAGAPADAVAGFLPIARSMVARENGRNEFEVPEGLADHISQPERQAAFAKLVSAPALAWAEAKGEDGLIAAAVQQQADRLLQSAWAPGQADHPWAGAVRMQYAGWQRLDPQAAGEWLATMPGDLKTLITTNPLPNPTDDAAR